jgi:hypothetical protein
VLCSLFYLAGRVVPVRAGAVDILQVELLRQQTAWSISVTLQHADTGWQEYADAWRVVAEDGTILGTRVLYHPHEDEQPFTRSLAPLHIPASTTVLYVEAHCNVHGWSPQRLRVDLQQSAGERFRVTR